MLSVPAKGFNRSVSTHNVEVDICADWLEASALFTDTEVSAADVVDLLRETELYATQDFAWEFVDNVFSTINRRAFLMGENYPFAVKHGSRLTRKDHWKSFAPYSFCLALSLSQLYPVWASSFGKNYTRQGELFENLTAESLKAHYVGWTVKKTGWTRTTPKKIQQIVAEVSSWLGEGTGAISTWTRELANEAGLDLLCFRQYEDFRGGFPAFLVQCASGKDWKEKLKTPDLRIWEKIVTFSSGPKKALSMPFALSEKDFIYHCNIVDGLLLDRHRLLAPGTIVNTWITVTTSDELNDWIAARILTLPVLDNALIV
jgi:hypothetical protein